MYVCMYVCVGVCAHARMWQDVGPSPLHFVSALQRITEKDQSIETCWNIHLWKNMRLQMWMWQNGMLEPRSSARLTCHAVHQFEGKVCGIGRKSGYRSCVLCHIGAAFTHIMDQLSSAGYWMKTSLQFLLPSLSFMICCWLSYFPDVIMYLVNLLIFI